MGIPRSDTVPEIPSQSEFCSTNRQCDRDYDMSYPEPIAICAPHQTLDLNYSNKQRGSFQDSSLGHNFEKVSEAVLPRSFTELLTNCSSDVLQGLKEPEEEFDQESEIMKYMTDSSFHGYVSNWEVLHVRYQTRRNSHKLYLQLRKEGLWYCFKD
ncbi:hypothetical protein ACHQM5_018906 [Ranunculus cassubicifolius]